MEWRPTYTESEIRDAVENNLSYVGALRRLGLRPVGANHRTLKRHIAHYAISTEHFDPYLAQRRGVHARSKPLTEILVEHSTYARGFLKRRLFDSGLKARHCEMCGQGEDWRGRPMALILDHINGVGDDNRLENLRIVCPNCAATLDTHCGRRGKIERGPRECLRCGAEFRPRYQTQRYCSRECGMRADRSHAPHPPARKVARPPYEVLVAETRSLGFSAVGRKYGVSDNAVRKWMRWYEAHGEEFRGWGEAA